MAHSKKTHIEYPAFAPRGFEHFGHVRLDKAHNTRDLGGMPVRDGRRIADKRLIRSGELNGISDSDANVLLFEHYVKHVVDFRTNTEAGAAPLDDAFEAFVQYHHLSVFSGSAFGVTHSKGIIENLRTARVLANDIGGTVRNTYAEAVCGEMGRDAYKRFFEVLLSCEDGAVLWNCSAGKDRTGIAAMLVEHALGVDDKIIKADYLATNIFSEQRNQRLPYSLAPILALFGFDISPVFYVYGEYFDAVMLIMDEQFGGIDGYLHEALGVGLPEREQLQELYLQ